MNIIKEEEIRKNAVINVAEKIMIAARTAPKGKGFDNLFIGMFIGEDIITLANNMKEISKNQNVAFFERDANNILNAEAVVIIGTKIKSLGLNPCGFCGFENCEEKNLHSNVPCAFNSGDLGIAIGSAVSTAMQFKVDTRIMFSAGYTAIHSGLIHEDIKIAYAIPLSVSAKSPFFDRK